MQKNGWDYIPHVILGQFFRNSAWRNNIRGVLAMPEMVAFWNMEKVARA
jgi:peptide/nickel transport system substrate-binding protein